MITCLSTGKSGIVHDFVFDRRHSKSKIPRAVFVQASCALRLPMRPITRSRGCMHVHMQRAELQTLDSFQTHHAYVVDRTVSLFTQDA